MSLPSHCSAANLSPPLPFIPSHAHCPAPLSFALWASVPASLRFLSPPLLSPPNSLYLPGGHWSPQCPSLSVVSAFSCIPSPCLCPFPGHPSSLPVLHETLVHTSGKAWSFQDAAA